MITDGQREKERQREKTRGGKGGGKQNMVSGSHRVP